MCDIRYFVMFLLLLKCCSIRLCGSCISAEVSRRFPKIASRTFFPYQRTNTSKNGIERRRWSFSIRWQRESQMCCATLNAYKHTHTHTGSTDVYRQAKHIHPFHRPCKCGRVLVYSVAMPYSRSTGCVCVCVHIDALRHRGVLARQRSFDVFYKTCTRNISLFYFYFFPFAASSNDAITYAAVHCWTRTQSQKQITFEAL